MKEISATHFSQMMRQGRGVSRKRRLRRSKNVKQSKRNRLGERQNWRCCYCGVRFVEEENCPSSMSIEHVVPQAQGGTNHEDNLVAACRQCNSDRGDRDSMTYFDARWLR